jgi:hypothetical protein
MPDDHQMHPAGADVVSALLHRQLEMARRTEDAMLDGLQATVDRWCERRHRTVQAYSDFGRDMLAARSPQEIVAAWSELSKGAVARLAEDATDQMSLSAAMARRLADGPMALLRAPLSNEVSGAEEPADGESRRQATHAHH